MNKHSLTLISDSITYLAGDSNYTHIYFLNAPKQLYARTLSDFVQAFPRFIRIHKRYLVNPDHVVEYQTSGSRRAAIKVSKQWLPVSRRRIKAIKAFFTPKTVD